MTVNAVVEANLSDAVPTEPGLYWAQTSLIDEFDSIVEVLWQSPVFETSGVSHEVS